MTNAQTGRPQARTDRKSGVDLCRQAPHSALHGQPAKKQKIIAPQYTLGTRPSPSVAPTDVYEPPPPKRQPPAALPSSGSASKKPKGKAPQYSAGFRARVNSMHHDAIATTRRQASNLQEPAVAPPVFAASGHEAGMPAGAAPATAVPEKSPPSVPQPSRQALQPREVEPSPRPIQFEARAHASRWAGSAELAALFAPTLLPGAASPTVVVKRRRHVAASADEPWNLAPSETLTSPALPSPEASDGRRPRVFIMKRDERSMPPDNRDCDAPSAPAPPAPAAVESDRAQITKRAANELGRRAVEPQQQEDECAPREPSDVAEHSGPPAAALSRREAELTRASRPLDDPVCRQGDGQLTRPLSAADSLAEAGSGRWPRAFFVEESFADFVLPRSLPAVVEQPQPPVVSLSVLEAELAAASLTLDGLVRRQDDWHFDLSVRARWAKIDLALQNLRAAFAVREDHGALADPGSCPHRGHHGVTIAEGDPDHTVKGVPVAYAVHKTSWGGTLGATASNFSKG